MERSTFNEYDFRSYKKQNTDLCLMTNSAFQNGGALLKNNFGFSHSLHNVRG